MSWHPGYPPKSQRGAAVIIAIMVVALAAIAATEFMFRSHLEWRKFENRSDLNQARWILRAAEQWGALALMDDARTTQADHPNEAWAQELPPIESEGYEIAGRIEEQNSRFNLNNLVHNGKVDPVQLAIFYRLITALHLPTELADDIADWLDTDSDPQHPDGAENRFYQRQNPAYWSADRPLVSVQELLSVRGMTPEYLAQLRPYITALPGRTRINVNTVSALLLGALIEGMTLEEAQRIVSARARVWYRNLSDFRNQLPYGLQVNESLIDVNSSHFLIHARARHGRIAVGSRALVRREGNAAPTILWRGSL